MNTDYIDGMILRLCKQPRSFEFVVNNLNGLDPVQINESFVRLKAQDKIHSRDGFWVIRDSPAPLTINLKSDDPQLYLKKYMGYFDFLKLPHPLDFEWRNSTASLNFLSSQIQELNSINDRILILGMPTLFATTWIKDVPQKVTLVERNKPIVKGLSKLCLDKERFRIVEADIFKVSPKEIGNYHCVIIDPPWYSEHFYQFMWLAAKCVEVGGVVGISLPPINTRPEIDKERSEWIEFCQKQGLCIENLYSQKLQYAMPFFEFNAFRAAGIKDISPFWRKGDLAYFRKVRATSDDRPKLNDQSTAWTEVEVDSIRIRIKDELQISNEPDLTINHLLKGDILPSVSTRDARRKSANVWSSGNRIYHVNNTSLFLKLLKDYKQETGNGDSFEIVKAFARSLTDLEKKEYNNYLEWLYYEMERQSN